MVDKVLELNVALTLEDRIDLRYSAMLVISSALIVMQTTQGTMSSSPLA